MEELRDALEQAKTGNLRGFTILVERFQNMAVGYAYSILRDFHLAEDAAQEAFTEAYPNLHKVYGPEAFPSWFRKILFKHCDRTLRGKRLNATRLEAAGSVAATDGDPASIAEARELEAELRKAVNSLPPTARSAITLFYISGCIPPGQSAEFVCAMEDVLEVYQRPYDGNEVLVCMDETSKQQVKETRVPRPAAPGLSAAYDYEYERNGVSSLFMLFAPLDGWRRVEVRERRTKVDWAHVIKKLVDEDYPDRDRIVLVMDNLNTHKLSSLYEAFEPAEARRIAERLEIHYRI